VIVARLHTGPSDVNTIDAKCGRGFKRAQPAALDGGAPLAANMER
jgi:hypothetical protein